jgi:uncharacterized protein DUF4124
MKRSSAALLCLVPLLVCAQQIYKWTDASGVVHFSQNPPAQGSYENVTPDLPPPGAAPKYHSSEPSAHAEPQATQAQADNEERCAKARERVSFLEDKTAHRLFTTGPDGQPARMTDEEFDSAVKDANDAAQKYCQ